MADERKTILHADDVPRWRNTVKGILSGSYDVESREDFDGALARLSEGGIDLLVLDALMPGDHPLDEPAGVIAHIRRHAPDLPIIVLTGALADSPTAPSDFEESVGAPVVIKGNIESEADGLLARVRECLG